MEKYRVIGETDSGEHVVFGFGFTKEGAEEFKAEKEREEPINRATKEAYHYRIEIGGAPPAWLNR